MFKFRQRFMTFITLVLFTLTIGGRVVVAQDVTPTNQPPIIDGISAQVVDVGQTVTVGLNYSDPDGDTVSISALSDNPAATVTLAGNQLAVTGVSGGTANITVTADDGRGGGSNTSFSVTVNAPPPPTPTNNPPILNALAAQTLNVGQSGVVALSYSDPDGDALTVSASSDNVGVVTVAQTSATELTVSGIAEGAANITVTVDDGKGGTASVSFAVSVNAESVPSPVPSEVPTNNPPVIAPINPQVVEVGQSVVVPVGYSDPDGDAVTLSLVSDNLSVATVSQSSAVELTVAGVGTFEMRPGDRDFMPAGTIHAARVVGDEPVEYLIGSKRDLS